MSEDEPCKNCVCGEQEDADDRNDSCQCECHAIQEAQAADWGAATGGGA